MGLKFLIKVSSFVCLFYHSFLISEQCAQGDHLESYLEIYQGQSVLHLKGSPYELGYQHGRLLKKQIEGNVKQFVDDYLMANQEHPQIKPFIASLPSILTYVPMDYQQELKGLADGAGIPYEKILLLNLIPEMFHCTGLTVSGKATANRELYHVRVLDYAVGKNLQHTAVLMVVEPEGKIPFMNVSYAGFIGCITGMNLQKIALGELGGKGYGHWNGMPMAFLLRYILERAVHLEDVKSLLTSLPRTCEYYYVFSDGKNNESFGVYATEQQLGYMAPGMPHALFDSSLNASQGEEKEVVNHLKMDSSPYQTLLYKDERKEQLWGMIHYPLADCLALIGFCHPARYPVLMSRLKARYGQINAQDLQEIIKTPVARPSNLHNAIFAPRTLEVWIAHAGKKGELACDQPYHHFEMTNLMHLKKK